MNVNRRTFALASAAALPSPRNASWPTRPASRPWRSAPRPPTSGSWASTTRPTRSTTSTRPRCSWSSSPATTARPPRLTKAGSPSSTHDYKGKGVAVVAISPNDPAAVRLDELGYTDVGDSFLDMKIRAREHKFAFPYLYDGETQSTAVAYGVLATPHVYVFDADRKLRYVGRFDDSEVKTVKSHDTVNAVEALLAGKSVPVEKTRVFGCSTKWAEKRKDAEASLAKWDAEPVSLEPIDDGGRREARQERHQGPPPREPLGDLVRPVRRRDARVRDDEPDVPRPQGQARHDQHGRPRQARRRPQGPQGDTTSPPPTTSSAPTTRTSSPRPSTRNGPAPCPTRS